MLENIKTGKPSHEGITEEDIKIGLSSIRSNRSAAAMSGGKAASKKKAKQLSPLTPRLSQISTSISFMPFLGVHTHDPISQRGISPCD